MTDTRTYTHAELVELTELSAEYDRARRMLKGLHTDESARETNAQTIRNLGTTELLGKVAMRVLTDRLWAIAKRIRELNVNVEGVHLPETDAELAALFEEMTSVEPDERTSSFNLGGRINAQSVDIVMLTREGLRRAAEMLLNSYRVDSPARLDEQLEEILLELGLQWQTARRVDG